MKTLVIAEKPKVANEILKLPRFRGSTRKQGSKPFFGYYENDNYIVTWCIGHLLEVKNPEEFDEKYKRYNFTDLPIFIPIEYKPIEGPKEQLEYVVNLMKRDDVDHVVNACDNDREGELIFREIYEHAKINKKVSRIFKSSHESDELEAAFNSLLPGAQFDSLAQAAKARQYIDFVLGINITRASTTKLANNQLLLASGRIQMVLLAEVYKRQKEVENFKVRNFYNLEIQTQNGIKALFKTEREYLDAEPLIKRGELLKGDNVLVKEFEAKESKKHPKNLYNLTDIYKEAIDKLKANTTIVQKHIQNLYDSGYITYPRTDSRHLPSSRLEKVQAVFEQLSNNEKYKELTGSIEPLVINLKHNAFNDDKVTAHYAIVPTSKIYNEDGRPELEKQLYDMIVKRFLGKFMSPAVYNVRKVTLVDNEGSEYHATEKVLKEPGFLKIFKEDIEENLLKEFTLPLLNEGESLTVNNYLVKEGKTRKPSLHTESTILSFMENAGNHIEDEDVSKLLKGKRIGTTATEHSFLPKLLERKYIEMDPQGRFTATKIGSAFIVAFPVEELKNPDFTAELEGGIEAIKDQEDTFDNFVQRTNDLTITIVNKMRDIPESEATRLVANYNEQIEICSCLCRVGKLIDKGKFYGCNRYPECDVSFPKEMNGKKIPVNQIQKLFEKGTTDLIKGFKKEDKVFDAFIVREEKKFKYRFPTAEDRTLGQCPKCKKGHVIPVKTKENKQFFSCSEYKQGCNFSVPYELLGVKIPVGQVKKYVKDGQTDFINGFIKGDKEFTAALVMKHDFGLEFKFPTKEDKIIGKCRLCNGNVLIGKEYYLCENYKKSCDFIIPSTFFSKNITTSQVAKLLANNMTDLIKGFEKKDKSAKFDAKLTYSSEEKRLKFMFPKKK